MAEDKKKEIDVTVIEVTEEYLKEKLYKIRGKRVLLDADLAEIYGYDTKGFNRQVKNNIEKFDKKDRKEMKSVNNYKIIFTEEDGKENIKIFEKIEYSSRAKLLLNEIENSIDEMGYSITEEEKRQVLMEVLKKLC